MKSLVAQHEPSPELVAMVARIPQPAWKRWFRVSDRERPAANKERPPLWQMKITVPAPVLAVLLIAVALGAWFLPQRFRNTPSVLPKVEPVKRATNTPASGDVMAFSRFDRGQRASIYKTRR